MRALVRRKTMRRAGFLDLVRQGGEAQGADEGVRGDRVASARQADVTLRK
jgi:hypothetical protein